ncbi:hypothetical protein [Thalassobius sp. I31.1]|uniref:hypothetical protein n=1 Tax=Thalassobius sp. I31.1 TaxID=2109912 RepID=UPI000D1BF5EF|nr:hypothetical protein [Thalassobius sp. I31.1]
MVGVRYSKTNPADAWAFRKWGDKLVKKQINPMIDRVARTISLMPQGEKCECIEVGQRTSRIEVYLFADFNDGVRMWFRESDLSNPVVASQLDASAACPWGNG